MRHLPSIVLGLLVVSACGGPVSSIDPDGGSDAGTTAEDSAAPRDAGPTPVTLGTADRPARLVMPPAHDGTTELPLLVLLHGYGASGALQDAYFKTTAIARARGFYLVIPDGTMDTSGRRFWNAQPACCDFGGTGVDDVGYITSLIDQAEAALPVDRTRVYLLGHSNGGFMSYRMACEIGDRLTGIAVLAGGDFPEVTDCVPARPVSVLHMHGTLDTTIAYTGLAGAAGFAGAVESSERWATRAGCDLAMTTSAGPFEFDTDVAGDEMTETHYDVGCSGAAVALYTMEGSGHIPSLPQPSVERAIDWLLTRTAPAP